MTSRTGDIRFNIEKAYHTDHKVQNLAHFINVDLLMQIHRMMDKWKAVGVDEVTKDMYEKNLDENLKKLVQRMKDGTYRPKPSRRVYIPKDGSSKMRPLGISSYEDKLVENAIAKILTAIYEPKFYNCSYGFRPNRNCHMAVREIIETVQYRYTNFVVEADIRSFFDTVDHDYLMKMLEHDIADRKFLNLIWRFLKAGIMEQGKYLDKEMGTPQGNGASPILANIYLHYVLDNWFDVIVQRQCRGRCYLVRYADDFLCAFENEYEAKVFRVRLEERFSKYGLSLAEEKTRMLEFGRNAASDRKLRGEGKPETFDFLGFTFYCSMDRNKRFFRCKVKTCKKRFRSKARKLYLWIKDNRTLPLQELFKRLNRKLKGHYQYYGVTDNAKGIREYRNIAMRSLYKWLNRRSQKRSYTWNTFYDGLLKTFPLAEPKICVCLFNR